jgi:dTMP kinase
MGSENLFMQREAMPGQFIVFEGSNTPRLNHQASLLAAWLRTQGATVLLARQPSNGPVGALVQQVDNGRLALAAHSRAVLALADRLDSLYGARSDGILAALADGKTVIGVNYLLEALAQPGPHPAWLRHINAPCPRPDLTVLLDTPQAEALRQVDARPPDGPAVLIVDGSLPAEHIHQQCQQALRDNLGAAQAAPRAPQPTPWPAMPPNPHPGKLIVLEGLDGAGTTTQAARLAEWLARAQGVPTWVTREPSGGPVGAQIRAILAGRITVAPQTMAALFAADRLDHLFGPGGVAEHLARGEWVILDRYYHSSFAYQTLSLNEGDHAWMRHLHAPCLTPDVTFFLDVPAAVCMERICHQRAAPLELFEKADFLAQVEEQYGKILAGLRQEGENICTVDGTLPVEAVAVGLQRQLEGFLAQAQFRH